MKITLPLSAFLLAAAGASDVSGTVQFLDGTPLAGAVVRLGADSVATEAPGRFVLARSAAISGIRPAVARSRSGPELRGERLFVVAAGRDIRGRMEGSGAAPVSAPARSLGGADSLEVLWKGKRLVRLPLPPDTGSLVLRVDTAWADDAGIAWNAHVDFGSLRDDRDGRVYRTTRIGTRVWMAENLDFAGTTEPVGVCPAEDGSKAAGPSDSCARYGRLYSWTQAMALDTSYAHLSWTETVSTPRRGACPSGWHLPQASEWDSLALAIGGASAGRVLQSVSAWSKGGNGTDATGFRALPAGGRNSTGFVNLHDAATWWTREQRDVNSAFLYFLNSSYQSLDAYNNSKTAAYSVRCLED